MRDALDHQLIMEVSYINIPIIVFFNTHSLLRYPDIAAPRNDKSAHSIGFSWSTPFGEYYFKCRRMACHTGFRDPEDTKNEQAASKEFLRALKIYEAAIHLVEKPKNRAVVTVDVIDD
uniref:Uncharacterized protein n=1 Tax=Glossina austeni TaxID=7395 RepID=A0A1A9VHU3_GLOAU